MISLSPSSLERVASCPGSYWAEHGLPWQDSPYAAEGNLLHAVIGKTATEAEIAELTAEQKLAIRACSDAGRDLVEQHIPAAKIHVPERKLECLIDEDVRLSGRVDYVGIDEDAETALVIDWKFGRSFEQAAEINWQLGAYALLVARNHRVKRIMVALFQPRVELERRLTIAEYDEAGIADTVMTLQHVAAEIRAAKDQPARNPGERQCKYCKAAGSTRCPESQALVQAVADVQLGAILPTGAELGRLLHASRTAVRIADLIESHAKEELRQGREVPGWRLTSGKEIRTLPDAAAAWGKVEKHLAPSEFVSICKVGVGDLQTKLRERLGWKAKESNAMFNALLDDAIVRKQTEGSLEAV